MAKDFVVDMENENFRTGTYLRLEVHDVPFQVVKNFDPRHPILVVGLEEEENVGYMQVRIKRHNWHMKLLKSSDAVTVSAGWRRYLTKPIYAREIDDARHEILEFISEHLHCVAMFWGPPGTRIAVVHGTKEVFRITAKAVVLDPKSHMKIMKRRELEGKPRKILDERTALFKFKSKDIDVAGFEGSPIRTNFRCIWGKVNNKAEKRKGIARCTFEKRIYKSDTFIMPVFVQVGAPRFFEPFDSKMRLRVEQQRRLRVEIIDEEPCSHPDSAVYTMFRI
ncbi:hypothetical protein C5167_012179 [Papaver somniferum]|uniref:Ribosome biogenesis protein BMS1/TSR1 C-terminal domain-containing protein n=1 Tax=Papaver somniferum TaxID=3469 RepID=A0A4Y7J0X2_PAPSO|nr:hypothetical protein C5167_012179 [Papaver somniferum]